MGLKRKQVTALFKLVIIFSVLGGILGGLGFGGYVIYNKFIAPSEDATTDVDVSLIEGEFEEREELS